MITLMTGSYDGLTLRRQRFVDGFIESGSATAAAESAGYARNSRHSLEVEGSRLLRNADVQGAIGERVQDAAERAGVSATTIFTGLKAIAENDSDPATAARVAAWRELAERVIGPSERRAQESHLHVSISPERMRRVAQRLASELGAPGPDPTAAD